mmetsp:Transcript_36909/g.73016  ORF Transcript_36909/g.73016 Transcript_36909/m.73016 type:complete len:258 (-) Transcript_36909:44-817(-)
MVYFECSKCNETVKKPKLAKHLQVCQSYYVSCIDCNKIFAWDAWEAHTSCVSEAQKYQGDLYQAKDQKNTGKKKQDAWLENVERRVSDPGSDIAPGTRQLMQKLLGFDNIPRKPKPFANFVKNSMKLWDERRITEIWEVISAANAAPANAAATPGAPAPAAPATAAAQAQDGSSSVAATSSTPNVGNSWVGWKRALDEELKEAGGELPWKKLRDTLVTRCCDSGGANGTSKEDLNCQALACIPDGYLSKKDSLVRLQ